MSGVLFMIIIIVIIIIKRKSKEFILKSKPIVTEISPPNNQEEVNIQNNKEEINIKNENIKKLSIYKFDTKNENKERLSINKLDIKNDKSKLKLNNLYSLPSNRNTIQEVNTYFNSNMNTKKTIEIENKLKFRKSIVSCKEPLNKNEKEKFKSKSTDKLYLNRKSMDYNKSKRNFIFTELIPIDKKLKNEKNKKSIFKKKNKSEGYFEYIDLKENNKFRWETMLKFNNNKTSKDKNFSSLISSHKNSIFKNIEENKKKEQNFSNQNLASNENKLILKENKQRIIKK